MSLETHARFQDPRIVTVEWILSHFIIFVSFVDALCESAQRLFVLFVVRHDLVEVLVFGDDMGPILEKHGLLQSRQHRQSQCLSIVLDGGRGNSTLSDLGTDPLRIGEVIRNLTDVLMDGGAITNAMSEHIQELLPFHRHIDSQRFAQTLGERVNGGTAINALKYIPSILCREIYRHERGDVLCGDGPVICEVVLDRKVVFLHALHRRVDVMLVRFEAVVQSAIFHEISEGLPSQCEQAMDQSILFQQRVGRIQIDGRCPEKEGFQENP